MSAIRRRSRNGCKTCKRRRRKCDERRPTCLRCAVDGLECEGYNLSLVWKVEKQPGPFSKCGIDCSNEAGEHKRQYVRDILDRSSIDLDVAERKILDEFIDVGRYDLHSRQHDSPPLEEFLENIFSSKAAIQACLAIELAMRGEREKMMHYFTEAISEFREILKDINDADYPGVLAAAVLICCCAFCTQQPWRFHLGGILAIVEMCQPNFIDHPGVEWSLQCMCLYDMDVLRISSTNEPTTKLLWQRYCMGKSSGIQAVTGIPMSLIHILSHLRWKPDAQTKARYSSLEDELWKWNEENPPTSLDNCVWDAWRYGMLIMIYTQLEKPKLEMLISRAMSAIMNITLYCERFTVRPPNSIFWPLMITSTCPSFPVSERKHVRYIFDEQGIMFSTPTLRLATNHRAWTLIQEVWNTGATPQEVVSRHSWTEMCLL